MMYEVKQPKLEARRRVIKPWRCSWGNRGAVPWTVRVPLHCFVEILAQARTFEFQRF
jgi:hypothetical protein